MSHIGSLKQMRKGLDEAVKKVHRKRGWRPSEKAMTVASFLEDIRALDAAIAALSAPVPKWEGYFSDFQAWVNDASRVLTGRKGSVGQDLPAFCVDAKGRRCHVGKDFERARDEKTFPIRYAWECIDAVAEG